MNKTQKRQLFRILLSGALFVAILLLTRESWPKTLLFLLLFFIIGWDVLYNAIRNTLSGQMLDEHFLMAAASVGAFCIGEATEAVAVMMFYQVGELFQSCAVSKARRSIADLMDIAPEYANLEVNGSISQVDPSSVEIGSILVIKPGEKNPA